MNAGAVEPRSKSVPLETVLVAPLDAVRSVLLRALGRPGRALLADRGLRIAAYGLLGLLFALFTTCAFPAWSFALGPVLLGPVHLLADVRYLVVRPGLLERRAVLASVGLLLAAAAATGGVAVGLAVSFGAIAFSRTSLTTRAVVFVAWSLVVALAAAHPREASFVVLHGHNAVALVLFLFAFSRPGERLLSLIPTAFAAAVALAFVTGALDPWLFRALGGASPATALAPPRIVDVVAPLSEGRLAVRFAFLFVFAQSVHYVFWLRLVPEAARERIGVRSFASTLTALRRDVGRPLVLVTVLGTIALVVRCFHSLDGARVAYLHVAGPHAYLEIAVLFLAVLDPTFRRALPAFAGSSAHASRA